MLKLRKRPVYAFMVTSILCLYLRPDYENNNGDRLYQ